MCFYLSSSIKLWTKQIYSFDFEIDEWMDDLRFYVLFISMYQDDGWMIMEGSAMELRLRLKRFTPPADLKPGTAKSAGHT